MGRKGHGNFGVKVGTKFVKTNKNMPQKDRQYFTPAELAVIDSGKMEVEKIHWFDKREKSKAVDIDDDKDTCYLDTGKPGSDSRIAALSEFYAENEKLEKSPFVADDNEIADGLIRWYAQTKIDSDNGKQLPKIGEKNQKRAKFSENDTIIYNMIDGFVKEINAMELE